VSGNRQVRQYVFSRLLVCACGRHLTSRTYHRPGYAYYRCRGNEAEGTCDAAKEPDLLPWGQQLFERLDALQPTDFKDQIDGYRGARSGRISKDAITSLDRMLERVKRLYVLGDFDEARSPTLPAGATRGRRILEAYRPTRRSPGGLEQRRPHHAPATAHGALRCPLRPGRADS
jgi:Recombinase zinc beta ribbon domain